MKDTILYVIIGSLLGLFFVWAVGRAIDIKIANQDTMLCNSATRSGNEEYLLKCKCFYQGGEIECLQK